MPSNATHIELHSIGVTSISRIEKCELSVALAQDWSKRILLAHPYGLMGDVYHDFLEQVATLPDRDPKTLQEQWSKSLQRKNRHIQQNQLEAHWHPLEKTADDLERYRLRAMKAAIDMPVTGVGTPDVPGQPTPEGAATPAGSQKFGAEVEVQMPIGGAFASVLKGKIDFVRKCPEHGLTLIDYKSGSVHEDDGSLKAEYEQQLLLYASMYEHVHSGQKVNRLLIQDSNGQQHEVAAEEARVQQCRDHAIRIAQQFAEKCARTNNEDAAINSGFEAKPGDHCWSCEYRHRCDSHRNRMIRGEQPEHATHQLDVSGVVQKATGCSGDRLALEIQSSHLSYLRCNPPGTPPQPGQRIFAFGVKDDEPQYRRDGLPASIFVELPWTHIETPPGPSEEVLTSVSRPRKEEIVFARREVRDQDITLEISGNKLTRRTAGQASSGEQEVLEEGMETFFTAFVAAVREVERHIELRSDQQQLIWCKTPQATSWLKGIPKKSLERVENEASFTELKETYARWKSLIENGVIQIQELGNHPRYEGTIATVYQNGKPIVRVAKTPSGTPSPMRSGTSATQMADEPCKAPPALQTDLEPDIKITCSALASQGTASAKINFLNTGMDFSGITTDIAAEKATGNRLTEVALIGLLKELSESSLKKIVVECTNRTALHWLIKPKVFDSSTLDPATREKYDEVTSWWASMRASPECTLSGSPDDHLEIKIGDETHLLISARRR